MLSTDSAAPNCFAPVDGVQDEWTLLYRFDNAAHLDTWLTSP